MFLYGGANVVFGVNKEYRLATRLDGVGQSSSFFRLTALARLLLRDGGVCQFLVGNGVNGDYVGRLVPVFMGQFQARGLARRQVNVFFGRRNPRRNFFRFQHLQLSTPMVVCKLRLELDDATNVSSLFNRLCFVRV